MKLQNSKRKENTFVIIDDDSNFREVLKRSFTRLDYQTSAFSSPECATASIENQKNCIVLLDLKLENDSGLRWIQTIKYTNPKCTVILLTGYASISTAVEAIKLGADDYLTKPTTAREIISHLESKETEKKADFDLQPMSVERLEWEHIQKNLLEQKGNISATARALGMHRRTLQRKLAKKPARK